MKFIIIVLLLCISFNQAFDAKWFEDYLSSPIIENETEEIQELAKRQDFLEAQMIRHLGAVKDIKYKGQQFKRSSSTDPCDMTTTDLKLECMKRLQMFYGREMD